MGGIVVGLFNPKGGSGKTTLTAAMATIFHAYFKHLTIASVDIDYLQQNLSELRTRDNYLADNYENYAKLREKYGSHPVSVATSENAIDEIKNLKKEYDVVFVDAPGTLLDDKLNSVLLNIDYFIVPCYPDALSMDTTIKFVEILKALEGIENAKIKDKTILFNQWSKIYEKSPENKFELAQEVFEQIGVDVLKGRVFKRAEMESKRSTIFPLPYRKDDEASFYNIVQEVLVFLQLVN